MRRQLLIFAKTPELGRVKTRLQPRIPVETSLKLHRAFVADTLELAEREDVSGIVVAFSSEPDLSLVPPGVEVDRQVGADLGERLVHATRKAFEGGVDRVVVIGTDSPDLPYGRIRQAFEALDRSDVCLGPAADGGYYLIGLRSEQPRLFEQIDWGTERVLAQTKSRAVELGLQVAQLEMWFDVDYPEDLARLGEEIAARRQAGLPLPWRCAEQLDLLGPFRC